MSINFCCAQCEEEIQHQDLEKDIPYYTISLDEFDDDQESSEGGMGAKLEYWKTWEGSCDECGSHISITLNATEYPIGLVSPWEVNGSVGASDISLKSSAPSFRPTEHIEF